MANLGLQAPGTSLHRGCPAGAPASRCQKARQQHVGRGLLQSRPDQEAGTSSRGPVCRCQSALVEADTQPALEPQGQASPLDSVRLDSAAGVSYDQLRQHLAAQEFQRADDETRAKLCQLAGKDAMKRNWVYFSEVQFIPAQDLQTIDALWRAASDNLFGFSIQREVWKQNKQYWTRMFKDISWVQGERNNYRKWPGEFIYDLSAPRGHLPLTNCLRGTQLFQAIMEHPAFHKEDAKPPPSNGSSGSSAYKGLF